MSISRRKFLGWLGAAGLGTTLSKTARAASNKSFEGYPQSSGVLYDSTRCIGCRKCEEGCNRVNELPAPDRAFDDLSVMDVERRTTAKAYTIVNRYDSSDGSQSARYRKVQALLQRRPERVRINHHSLFPNMAVNTTTIFLAYILGFTPCLTPRSLSLPVLAAARTPFPSRDTSPWPW